MPRYFFDLADGRREVDRDGVDLPDVAAARAAAVRFAGELLSGEPEQLWEKHQWRVEVTGEDGALLCTVIALAFDAPAGARRPGDDAGATERSETTIAA